MAQLVGHTALIYSCAATPAGLIASGATPIFRFLGPPRTHRQRLRASRRTSVQDRRTTPYGCGRAQSASRQSRFRGARGVLALHPAATSSLAHPASARTCGHRHRRSRQVRMLYRRSRRTSPLDTAMQPAQVRPALLLAARRRTHAHCLSRSAVRRKGAGTRDATMCAVPMRSTNAATMPVAVRGVARRAAGGGSGGAGGVPEDQIKPQSALLMPGSKDGAVMFVRNAGGAVEAHEWSTEASSWSLIGEVMAQAPDTLEQPKKARSRNHPACATCWAHFRARCAIQYAKMTNWCVCSGTRGGSGTMCSTWTSRTGSRR